LEHYRDPNKNVNNSSELAGDLRSSGYFPINSTISSWESVFSILKCPKELLNIREDWRGNPHSSWYIPASFGIELGF